MSSQNGRVVFNNYYANSISLRLRNVFGGFFIGVIVKNFKKIYVFTALFLAFCDYSLLAQSPLTYVEDPITDSIVLITSEQELIVEGVVFTFKGRGSGTIIEILQNHPTSEDLVLAKILTAEHVIDKGKLEVESHLGSKDLSPNIFKRSKDYDVATITAFVSKKCKAVEIGEVKEYDKEVLVMGYPFAETVGQFKCWKSKTAAVSGEFVLLDTRVSPGASGGAVILDNKLVGVVSRGIGGWFNKPGKPQHTWPTVTIGKTGIDEVLK